MSFLWAAALWISAYVAGRRRFGLRAAEAILYGGLLFFAEAISSTMLLGLLGVLNRFLLSAFCLGFLAVHVKAAAKGMEPRPARRPELWLLVPNAIFLAALALRMFLALITPPDSWDGLSYHLPIAMRFVEQKNLDLAGWYGTERYYAWNGELLTAWLAVLDGGSLLFAKISQFFALPLMAAAGAVLGRRLAGPRWSGACSLGLAAVPTAIIQAGVPYVDLLYCSFFAASAAAATVALRTGGSIHYLAAATGFALALGAKSTIYFTVLLAAAPVLAYRHWQERRPVSKEYLRAIAVVILVLGLATYLRNWIQRGNPIYPFEFAVMGWKVFPGPLSPKELLVAMEKWFVSAPVQWLWYPLHERVKGLAEYSYENGFGPLFAAGWVLWPFAFHRAWRTRDRAATSFLGLLPAAAFLFMVLQPVRAPRYFIFAACVPIVALAYLFRRATGLRLAAARTLWTGALALGLLGVVGHLGQSDGPRAAWRSLRAGWPMSEADYYRRTFFSLGEAWTGANARLEKGDVLAVNYGELLLPWGGSPPRAKAVVVYGARSVYPDSYFGVTAEDWLGQLQALGVRFTAVWSPRWYPKVGDSERSWIAEHPHRFKQAGHWESAEMGRIDLYELVKP